ncbi:Putative short-chain dehydrogenase/reductase SDR [Sodalis praecaptivus]|uniref:Putative short-chain dehydrogenase/reductase SDR n=1 Tax=Sodalis praecaptivus TaxID=1239307 RepID=W0HYA9_9GAMM|nr:SDR family oxidoreductase [Sodalis praecaptivus]AHF77195.1 Putative short-chain dehydrogenase/reductase SDR [Sodalis praecaptivus]
MTSSVAIITGAGGGIGGAIASRLARQGWRLVLADNSRQALVECQEQCASLGAEVRCVQGDLRREQDVAGLVAVADVEFGGCQGFVSNAGIAGVVEPIADYPAAIFRQVLEINTVGTFLCLKYALPLLRRTGGSFVAIASTSAIRGRANMSAYVASKHAVLGLVRSSALECLGSAVRVNAVLPGPTQTAMIEDINRLAAARSPQGEISRAVTAPYGKPEDVAHTVAFLLSSDARHINGAALVTDAGSTVA